MNTITDYEISQLPPPPIEWVYFSSNDFKAQLKKEVDYDQLHKTREFATYDHFDLPYNTGGIHYKNYSPLGLKKYNNINNTKKNKITCNKSTDWKYIDMYGNKVNQYYKDYYIDKKDLITWLKDCEIDHKKSWTYKKLAELFLKHW